MWTFAVLTETKLDDSFLNEKLMDSVNHLGLTEIDLG